MMTINLTVTYEDFDAYAEPGDPLISDCENYKIQKTYGYDRHNTRRSQYDAYHYGIGGWSTLGEFTTLAEAKAAIENHANHGDRPALLTPEFEAAFAEIDCPMCHASPDQNCRPDCLCYLP